MGCENMISLTQMKFVECHIFYVQKQNQDQEEAVFNRCGCFFWDRNSLARRLGESVFVFTLGSSSSNDMKLENGKFRCIIHYLRLSNASINA